MKLSPERYLTYPVATVHAVPGIVPVRQDVQTEVFPYKFKEGYAPHESLLVESLRNARLETLDADNDFESLAYASVRL